MKYNKLKDGDVVIFKMYSDILSKECFQDGVIVNIRNNKADISYLEGYKSRVELIDFDKIIAKPDVNGEYMKFDCFVGNFLKLEN
ncbi:hypothetical protein UT300012_31260 [Paraclostridium bifermentans]